jgi:hypothetical protein
MAGPARLDELEQLVVPLRQQDVDVGEGLADVVLRLHEAVIGDAGGRPGGGFVREACGPLTRGAAMPGPAKSRSPEWSSGACGITASAMGVDCRATQEGMEAGFRWYSGGNAL